MVNMEQKLNIIYPHKLLTTFTAVPDIVYHSMPGTGMADNTIGII
jgi:hypothetical protein